MRDYRHIETYLNKLIGDIYLQPEPDGNDLHGSLAARVIYHWMSRLTSCESVLDIGAGSGFCQPVFESLGVKYEGIALGEDVSAAQALGRNVKKMDFSFLEYPDNSFDLLFSRHSAEHSPSPLLSFMEWRRVSKQWLGLVVPSPDWYSYVGRNHYYVLNIEQWKNLLDVAGWHVIWEETDRLPPDPRSPEITKPHEYWLFSEKK
jgi:SAM-dependent methyltransferase